MRIANEAVTLVGFLLGLAPRLTVLALPFEDFLR